MSAAPVVGYAFSPTDLIPDSVPVLGCLDDLLTVSLGVPLAVWMIPIKVLSEGRQRAWGRGERPVSRTAAAVSVVARISPHPVQRLLKQRTPVAA